MGILLGQALQLLSSAGVVVLDDGVAVEWPGDLQGVFIVCVKWVKRTVET